MFLIRSLRICVILVLPVLVVRNGICAENRRLALIDLMIQEFSGRLGVSDEVIFFFVSGNRHLISVERAATEAELFQMALDEDFLRTLDDRELRAAIAHELGHIWIFTHFPYLHTESLANQYALKLVPHEDLDRVYEKARIWKQKQRESTPAPPALFVPR
jgi:hypothetical protein